MFFLSLFWPTRGTSLAATKILLRASGGEKKKAGWGFSLGGLVDKIVHGGDEAEGAGEPAGGGATAMAPGSPANPMGQPGGAQAGQPAAFNQPAHPMQQQMQPHMMQPQQQMMPSPAFGQPATAAAAPIPQPTPVVESAPAAAAVVDTTPETHEEDTPEIADDSGEPAPAKKKGWFGGWFAKKKEDPDAPKHAHVGKKMEVRLQHGMQCECICECVEFVRTFLGSTSAAPLCSDSVLVRPSSLLVCSLLSSPLFSMH